MSSISIECADSSVLCKDGTFHYEQVFRDTKTKATLNSDRGPEGAVNYHFMSDGMICVCGIITATAVTVCNLTEHNNRNRNFRCYCSNCTLHYKGLKLKSEILTKT